MYNYVLPDSPLVYYYARRGCAKISDQSGTLPAISLPPGYTNVEMKSQRTLTSKANVLQATKIAKATVFECYSCKSEMVLTVKENYSPSYNDVVYQDKD